MYDKKPKQIIIVSPRHRSSRTAQIRRGAAVLTPAVVVHPAPLTTTIVVTATKTRSCLRTSIDVCTVTATKTSSCLRTSSRTCLGRLEGFFRHGIVVGEGLLEVVP